MPSHTSVPVVAHSNHPLSETVRVRVRAERLTHTLSNSPQMLSLRGARPGLVATPAAPASAARQAPPVLAALTPRRAGVPSSSGLIPPRRAGLAGGRLAGAEKVRY